MSSPAVNRGLGVLARGQLAILLLLLTACGPEIDRLQVDPTPRPAQPVSAVQILLDEPRRPYQSIALIEARGGDVVSLTKLTRRLALEAARLGGDALLVSGRAGKDGLQARVIVFQK
jgi:hypothetical protein